MRTATKGKSKAQESPPKVDTIKINSRFGEIEVAKANRIKFKHGLLGIPAAVSFCVAELPTVESDQFQLMQCLEDNDLSFIVVPAEYDNQLIESADLDDACGVLGINTDDLLILFIVTVHEGLERYISVNAKAPVFVDTKSKTATQYVLQNSNYEIQHRIS